MGDDDLFLAALALELAATQRVLPSSCLFCVPQARSLVADERVTQDMLFAHVLIPADPSATSSSSFVHRPGAYETLSGKSVSIVGSQVFTGKGFDEKRKVRVLLSEARDVQAQQVLVLHVSRPLVGGIALPEDPNEIDVATFRRYTAMLRAFPENELVFLHLDETIAQAKKICRQNQFANRYETTLPEILREEWEYAVDEIARGGSLADEEEEGDERAMSRRPFASTAASHLLQIQQVVECYLMEQLHKVVFPRVMVSCRDDDEKLVSVLWQMRHYGPADFGLRKEFQCYLLAARNEIVKVEKKKTPLEMLLAFKNCIDHINDGVTRNLQRHHHSLDGFQLTTDDILDVLLYVLLQAYNLAAEEAAAQDERAEPHFPLVSVLKYVSDYHFINSNTSMLGYTIANFQVAVEYFLLKATHSQSCRVCYNIGSRRRAAWNSWDEAVEEQCPQAIVPSAIQAGFTRNYTAWLAAKERKGQPRGDGASTTNIHASTDEGTRQRLVILGDWSADESIDDSGEVSVSDQRSTVHEVEYDAKDTAVTQIGCGHRFFAIANDHGELLTWGDQSGSRLGFQAVQGDPRRVMRPRVVPALQGLHVLQVACGAFHTLVTDINGHVFAWGQNARGQLGFLTHALDTTTVEAPTLVSDLKGVYMSSVACGEYHSLGLSSEGCVFSWGCNKFTKLGRPTEGLLDAVQPRPIKSRWTTQSISNVRRTDDTNDGFGFPTGAVRRIAAGRDHSVAVTFDGAAFTWGRGDQGQLGHAACMDVPEPKQVLAIADDTGAMRVSDVSAGGNFTLFLLRDGAVFLTGRDPSRHVGQDTKPVDLLTPELVECEASSDWSFSAIAAGESHFALVSDQGSVFQSRASETSDSATTDETQDTRTTRRIEKVDGVERVTRVRAGASHTLVLCGGG